MALPLGMQEGPLTNPHGRRPLVAAVFNDVVVAGTLTVLGPTLCASRIQVTAGGLDVAGPTVLRTGATVSGSMLSVNAGATVSSRLEVSGGLSVSAKSTFSSLEAMGDVTTRGRCALPPACIPGPGAVAPLAWGLGLAIAAPHTHPSDASLAG